MSPHNKRTLEEIMGYAQKKDDSVEEVCQKAEIISLSGHRAVAMDLLKTVPEERKNKRFNQVKRAIDHQILLTPPKRSKFSTQLLLVAVVITLVGSIQWAIENFSTFLWMVEQLVVN